jgi:hypothetical protein
MDYTNIGTNFERGGTPFALSGVSAIPLFGGGSGTTCRNQSNFSSP